MKATIRILKDSISVTTKDTVLLLPKDFREALIRMIDGDTVHCFSDVYLKDDKMMPEHLKWLRRNDE